VSKITNDGLTRSGTGYTHSYNHMATVGVKGLDYWVQKKRCLWSVGDVTSVCAVNHCRSADAGHHSHRRVDCCRSDADSHLLQVRPPHSTLPNTNILAAMRSTC